MNIEAKARELKEEISFIGGPEKLFHKIGINSLIVLLTFGLTPDDKVLDFGCGALRGGYWLINFLHAGHYYGIEGRKEMVEAGQEILLDDETLRYKRPKFDYNTDFNFNVFDTTFDYIIARSVWTHMSKTDIAKTMNAFKTNTENGVLLASVILAKPDSGGYEGDKYQGRNANQDDGAVVMHDPEWLKEVAKQKELEISRVAIDFLTVGRPAPGQTWLVVKEK